MSWFAVICHDSIFIMKRIWFTTVAHTKIGGHPKTRIKMDPLSGLFTVPQNQEETGGLGT